MNYSDISLHIKSPRSFKSLDICGVGRYKQCVIRVLVCFPSVNNAGVGLLGPVESISIEEMKKVFETNFFGVVRMIKEVMPDMKERRSGHIVVMSSVMGLQGTIHKHRERCLVWGLYV